MKNFLTLAAALFAALALNAQTYKSVENIHYSESTDEYAMERCVLDVYYPEDLTGCPVVIWYHGGGLTGGNKYIPAELKEQGYVVIAANYRFIPKVDIEDCIDDAAAALAWAFKHASEYGGDPSKIIVSGHSAGGYLTAMVGLEKKWLEKYGVDADDICCLVPFSGQMITHFAHRDSKLGMGNLQPLIDEFAPLYHVRNCAPPLVLICGDRNLELYGRYEENAYMWRMMKLNGHEETYLYELDGYGHSAMAAPAFHILITHIGKVTGKPVNPYWL